jgi:hypothetical protein
MAAAASTVRTGRIQPARRATGGPLKSRRRSNARAPHRHAADHTTQTARSIAIGA